MATTIKHRRDTAAAWAASDLVLAQGEIGFEYDTGRFKIGDGVTPWPTLTYSAVSPDKGAEINGAWKFGGRPLVSLTNATIYVDSVNGLDTNAGDTTTSAIKTLAEAARRIPRFIRHRYEVRIIGNAPGSIDFEDSTLSAGGFLIIRGNSEDKSLHTISGFFRFFGVLGNLNQFMVDKLTFVVDTSAIVLEAASFPIIDNCVFRRTSGAPVVAGSSAVSASGGTSGAYVRSCDFGVDQFHRCLQAQTHARIMSVSNSGKATDMGLYATHGAVIAKSGAQPTGTTANEFVASGGVIR